MAGAGEIWEMVAGCRTRILRGGTGPKILFLHGGGGAGVWLPFFQQLSEHFEVIVPEHPGFGRSDIPAWLDNVGDLANFYLDFLEHLDLQAVHLVGHSLGGWTAAEISVRNTSRLKSLTLISAAGIHVRGAQKGDLFLWTPEERVRNLVVDKELGDELLAAQMADEERRYQMKNLFTLAKLTWQPRFYNPNLQKWLHRIQIPTLVIWGDSDKLIPEVYGPAYRDLIGGSKLEVLPNTGHLPHVEKSREVATSLIKFFKGAE